MEYNGYSGELPNPFMNFAAASNTGTPTNGIYGQYTNPYAQTIAR
jgi:hypothetical protein